jgi:Fic family protein
MQHRGDLNVRQEKALLRMMERGSTGFEGGMTASKYMAITRASPATATRDLAGLAELRALVPHGARRHMRYELQLPVRPVPTITVLPTGAIVETVPPP